MALSVQSLGTTSARSGDMIYKMSLFISALETYNENNDGEWTNNKTYQSGFTDYCIELEIVRIKNNSINSKAKFARQKTSLLLQFGFINVSHEITDLGRKMLENGEGSIPIVSNQQEAFIVAVLNFSKHNDQFGLRVFERLMNEEFITISEFKNMMVLERYSDEEKKEIINSIYDVESFIELFPNRKSKSYNAAWSEIWNTIGTSTNRQIFEAIPNTKTGTQIKKIIFGSSKKRDVNFPKVTQITREDFMQHLFTAKEMSLVEDYFDLNKRVLISTGIFLFSDGRIHLSRYFKRIFNGISFEMETITDLQSIVPDSLDENGINIIMEESSIFDHIILTRNQEFEEWISNTVTIDVLIELLSNIIDKRFDRIINFFGTDDIVNNIAAEFIIGIAYHYLTHRVTNFSDSWNGTYNEMFVPIMRAPGGNPDFNFIIDNKVIIVEPTISSGMAQTNMEITQASRHLNERTAEFKKAIIVAPRIFRETERQASIQRNSNNMIYTRTISQVITSLRELNV